MRAFPHPSLPLMLFSFSFCGFLCTFPGVCETLGRQRGYCGDAQKRGCWLLISRRVGLRARRKFRCLSCGMLNFFSKKPDPKEVLRQETRNLKRNEREIERERLGCVWCGVCSSHRFCTHIRLGNAVCNGKSRS